MSCNSILSLFFMFFLCVSGRIEALQDNHHESAGFEWRHLVKMDERRSLVETEYGEISAVDLRTGTKGPFHLQFITLEPNCLFLPVLLHADMVFYVHTGSGKLSWAGDGSELERVNLKKGDVFRLQPGSIFFLRSNLETQREKLRIHAIFTNADENVYEPSIGAYSRIADLVLGFDKKILQSGFKVPEDVIEEITGGMKQQAIVHAEPVKKSVFWQLEYRFLKTIVSDREVFSVNGHDKKKTKTKTFNMMDAKPEFENCNGWSAIVDKANLKSLKGSNAGVFMVNLTKGSMMGPHWNPMATEIAVVLHGQGMIRVVCSASSNKNESECKNLRFRVEEGDVFAVPRFHPMAQMSFNNDSFVFMGFSTTTKKNHPQFLVGKRSVFQTMDRHMLAVSFNVSNTTIDRLLVSQEESLILDCTSCAEEEERIMQEASEKEKEEEEARKREEERKKEEEERKRREEEAKKEEEEAKRREEERERKKQEEEEETKRQEEERERKKQKEEEEARKREEEERQTEEERQKQEEEERKREEEEKRKREEEQRRREEAAKREQEEAERQAEERERRRQEEEEAARKERERQEEEKGKGEPQRREEEGGEGGGGGSEGRKYFGAAFQA